MVRKTSVPRRCTGGCTEQREASQRSDDMDPQDAATAGPCDSETGSDSGSESDLSSDEELNRLAVQTFQHMKNSLCANKTQRRSARHAKDHSSVPDVQFVIDKQPEAAAEAENPQLVPESSTVQAPASSIESSSKTPNPESTKVSNRNRGKRRRGRGKRNEGGGFQLSSSLQVNINESDTYLNPDVGKSKTVGIQHDKLDDELVRGKVGDLMSRSVLTEDAEKKDTLPPYEVSLNQQRKQRRAEKEKTKGKGWFHLPATELTDEKKNDLLVLQYRRALDPKRFYKGPDIKAIPKYFQMGKVVDNPVDFYNSRIPKKQRKKTLVDELMEDADFRKFNKRKYAEIQETTRKGRGAHRHMKRLKKKK